MRSNDEFVRANSYSQGIGVCEKRVGQTEGPALPPGIIVVSADTHLAISEDIWYDRFPAHLKHKAPRVWFDEPSGLFHIGVDGKSFYPPAAHDLLHSIEGRPSTGDMLARMKDLDDEGISKEIVFPQTAAMFFAHPDLEFREWIFRGYNEFLSELQGRFPTRFFPVPVPNYWDPDKSAASVEAIKDLGLKTAMLPMKPGKGADGEPIYYGSRAMDAMWSAFEDCGLPVCFHIGETLEPKGPAALICEGMFQMGGGAGNFRKIFTELVFAGVFDRHPKLRVAFAEGGLNWIAACLQDAEMLRDSYADLIDYTPKERPSSYWYEHCYAMFMNDAVGLRQIDIIDADRVMWSSDYPHNESTFGYSRNSMRAVVDATSEQAARKILGGTAIELFDLD